MKVWVLTHFFCGVLESVRIFQDTEKAVLEYIELSKEANEEKEDIQLIEQVIA